MGFGEGAEPLGSELEGSVGHCVFQVHLSELFNVSQVGWVLG